METTNLDSDYTVKDIEDYISDSSLSKKSNSWVTVDKRRYVAHILRFKFGYTLDEIAETLQYKGVSRHSSVVHLFKTSERIFTDPQFLNHTEYVRKKFPFDLSKVGDAKMVEIKSIIFRPNTREMERLIAYQKRHKLRTIKGALKQIIQNL